MDNLTAQKLKMWKDKKAQLEKELKDAFTRKGEAAAMGDLSENAAYKGAIEDIEMYQARIEDIDKIIAGLEGGKK